MIKIRFIDKFMIGVVILLVILPSIIASNIIAKEGAIEVGSNFNASSTFFVDSTNKRVGVGISQPAYALEINNLSKALNVSGLVYINSTNVGIGTKLPTSILEVYTTDSLMEGNRYATNSTIYGGSGGTTYGINSYGAVGSYGQAYGGYFTGNAYAGGTSYGVYATAIGTGTNYAGYFDLGNVYIKNNLSIGITNANHTIRVVQGSSSDPIADAWTVYSDRNIKKDISLLNYSANSSEFNWTTPTYRYRIKPENATEYPNENQSRIQYGLMTDEAPSIIKGDIENEIDLYAFSTYNYELIKELKRRNDFLESELCATNNTYGFC